MNVLFNNVFVMQIKNIAHHTAIFGRSAFLSPTAGRAHRRMRERKGTGDRTFRVDEWGPLSERFYIAMSELSSSDMQEQSGA